MELETLDHDYTIHTRQGGGDEKLFVQFRNHYVLDSEATEEQARPIYRDEVFCRIITPGNRDTVIDRPVRSSDKVRFPKAWTMFQQGETEIGNGTRLEEWSQIPRSMVEELRYFGFRTVEHLAEAGDGALSKMPGLREWSDRAQVFLKAANDSAAITKAEAEKQYLLSEIETLKNQVAELVKLARPPEGGVPLPKK